MKINPIDDAALIYASSEQKKWSDFIKEVRKHPYKLYEYYTGEKLPLWKRMYMDVKCKLVKSSYEKQQETINKAISPFIRKK